MLIFVSDFHYVIVFLADAEHDAMSGYLREIISRLGFLSELAHISAGGEGKVVISE